MIESMLIAGLAIGAAYAFVGFTYNIMYSASKVVSFTAGEYGMLSAVVGAYLIGVLEWPAWLGLVGALLAGLALGAATELIAVRPVLKGIHRHLYVLSTLAVALMIQQVVANTWGTEPRPFPDVVRLGAGLAADKYWLPIASCLAVVVALELFYRRTIVGRAFVAISEDAFAARALGINERRMRIASFLLAGVVGSLGGFVAGQLTFAFFAVGVSFTFYGFIPVAFGGLGSNRGTVIGGFLLGILQQVANYLIGGSYVGATSFMVFIIVLLLLPRGIFGMGEARRV